MQAHADLSPATVEGLLRIRALRDELNAMDDQEVARRREHVHTLQGELRERQAAVFGEPRLRVALKASLRRAGIPYEHEAPLEDLQRRAADLLPAPEASATGFTYEEWQGLTGHPVHLHTPWNGLPVGTWGRILGFLPAEMLPGRPGATPGTGFLGAHLRVPPGTPATGALSCTHGNAADPYETALALLSRQDLEAFEILPKD